MDTIYNETYVKHTPYYHEEVPGYRDGEAGETPSYSIVNDGYMGIGFVVGILLSIVSIAKSTRFIRFQLKNTFRTPRENSFEMRETLDEMQYQIYFWVQGIFLYSILAYNIAKTYIAQEYQVSDYIVMALFCGTFAVYFLLKKILHIIVRPVFFSKSQRNLGGISETFIVAMQGALMLPIVLLNVYYDLSILNTLYIAFAILVMMLLLRFYKTYSIFFRKKGSFLQFFLYLCTLEAVPAILLIGLLFFEANFLKINI